MQILILNALPRTNLHRLFRQRRLALARPFLKDILDKGFTGLI